MVDMSNTSSEIDLLPTNRQQNTAAMGGVLVSNKQVVGGRLADSRPSKFVRAVDQLMSTSPELREFGSQPRLGGSRRMQGGGLPGGRGSSHTGLIRRQRHDKPQRCRIC